MTKEYHGLKNEGEIKYILDIDEIDINENETWMFLSRNHFYLKGMEEKIKGKGLVYSYNGVMSVKPSEIQAINIFEQGRKDKSLSKHDELSLRPFLKKKYNFKYPWYDNFTWSEDHKKYLRDLIHSKADVKKCNIRINTIHSVKGAEADNVVVKLDITKQIYSNLQRNPDSEYRVLYVGCTRVKKKLFIVESNSRYSYTLLKEHELWRTSK